MIIQAKNHNANADDNVAKKICIFWFLVMARKVTLGICFGSAIVVWLVKFRIRLSFGLQPTSFLKVAMKSSNKKQSLASQNAQISCVEKIPKTTEKLGY